MSNCKVFVANKAWRYKYDAVTPRSKYAVYVSGSYCNVTGLDIQQNCAMVFMWEDMIIIFKLF